MTPPYFVHIDARQWRHRRRWMGTLVTALLSRGGTDFNLACDGCGQLVVSLAPAMGTWDVAWGLFSQDGWRGTGLPTGPHACARCDLPPSAPGMVEQSLLRA